MLFSDLLILFLLSPSCFLIQPISSIPIVFSYSTYFIFARSSQSCFPIHPISFMLFIPIIFSISSYFFYALHSIYTSKLYFPVSSYAFSYHIFCSFSTSFSHGLSSLLYFPFYTISSNVLSYQSCFPFHSNFSSTLFHPNYTFLFILFLLCSFISIMFSFTFYFFYDSPPNRVFLVIFSALSS